MNVGVGIGVCWGQIAREIIDEWHVKETERVLSYDKA